MNDFMQFISDARSGAAAVPAQKSPSEWDRVSRPANRRGRNERSQQSAKRKWKPWTEREVAVAMNPDLTATEAASMTGRTWESVIRKRSRLRDAGR